MTVAVKEYVILDNGKEIAVSDTPDKLITTLSAHKYLSGFKTTVTKVKTDSSDLKIESYVQSTAIADFESKKTVKIMIERVHNNKATPRRIQLISRYTLPE